MSRGVLFKGWFFVGLVFTQTFRISCTKFCVKTISVWEGILKETSNTYFKIQNYLLTLSPAKWF